MHAGRQEVVRITFQYLRYNYTYVVVCCCILTCTSGICEGFLSYSNTTPTDFSHRHEARRVSNPVRIIQKMDMFTCNNFCQYEQIQSVSDSESSVYINPLQSSSHFCLNAHLCIQTKCQLMRSALELEKEML